MDRSKRYLAIILVVLVYGLLLGLTYATECTSTTARQCGLDSAKATKSWFRYRVFIHERLSILQALRHFPSQPNRSSLLEQGAMVQT